MRRLFLFLLVAVFLAPEPGPARAQATADQLNKLSLEALTTPAPGGNPGPTRHRSYQRAFYRGLSRSHRGGGYRRDSYHRPSGRSFGTRGSGYRRPYRSVGGGSRHSAPYSRHRSTSRR